MKNKQASKTWMVRCEGGRLYDTFREQKMVAIGWGDIAGQVTPGMSRRDIAVLYAQKNPTLTRNEIAAGTGQVWRFLNEMKVEDTVVTYSPDNRTYLFGKVSGEVKYTPDTAAQGLALSRSVKWNMAEIGRDYLSQQTKNSLGSTLSVFLVPDAGAVELAKLAAGKLPKDISKPKNDDSETDLTEAVTSDAIVVANPLDGATEKAVESIKDLVIKLDWDAMQALVAGILRAMGYKTQISAPGPDRGKDIIASPDGFGFEHPRIVVEVKHRSGQMGSADIRSFLGGRHKDDRGLYVSTGGFSKDAYYEADRATVPLTLWTLDTLVRALIEHYDNTDAETKRLVPLKRLYIPA